MKELSVTVTVGKGSEKHNHDLDYRSTLQHVHSRAEGVVELLPYRPYKEIINEAVKPYIDEYNDKQQARYQLAWDRYNSGQIKTKPRKRDFKPMGYDYYTDHLHDMHRNPRTGKTEEVPMWRSFIIGIGDQNDRLTEKITEEQARRIMRSVVENFCNDFPSFIVLGASLHLDEEGFYHIHLDYKPFYQKENPERGLSVGIGLEGALEEMGFKPEQSIINGRDKVPLLFNTMRNLIYHRVEEAMAQEGLRLQYGVSKVKEPGKDSSKNQVLETWQEIQDNVQTMQHNKNIVLETLDQDFVTDDDEKDLTEAITSIGNILEEARNSPKFRNDKSRGIVKFNIFDQLKSFIVNLLKIVGRIKRERDFYKEELSRLQKKPSLDDKTTAAEKRHQSQDFPTLPGIEKENQK